MPRDTLFLLKPDFLDDGTRCYCPACATVEGILAFYPGLRERLDVHYVDFPRPRPAVVALLGTDNQLLPALVLAPERSADLLTTLDVREAEGRRFLRTPGDIGKYLARAYGIGRPH